LKNGLLYSWTPDPDSRRACAVCGIPENIPTADAWALKPRNGVRFEPVGRCMVTKWSDIWLLPVESEGA